MTMLKKILNFFNLEKKKKIINTQKEKKIIFNKISLLVLDKKQQKFKKLLEYFSTTHFLGGGTAIALQLGHRKSIDFDFFSNKTQGTFAEFTKKIGILGFSVSELDKKYFYGIEFEEQDEIHVNINGVKLSLINFYRTLYNNQQILIKANKYILNGLKIASLEELIVMKLFAMISRKKWKDGVDVYFLLKNLNNDLRYYLNLAEKKYFINIFNKEAVLEQLLSKNWDKTEKVDYIIKTPPMDDEIENFLEKEALFILKYI